MSTSNTKILYNSNTAGTGPWVTLDSRYDNQAVRALFGTVTAGDTIAIQATTSDGVGIDKSFLSSLTAADITTLKTYTADFNDVLYGNWTYIRAVKTGTAGTSKVQGNL